MTKKELTELATMVAEQLRQGEEKEIMNHDEAADFLGVSRSWMYRLTSENKVPYYRPFGSRCYFRRSELEALIFSNRIPMASENKKRKRNKIEK